MLAPGPDNFPRAWLTFTTSLFAYWGLIFKMLRCGGNQRRLPPGIFTALFEGQGKQRSVAQNGDCQLRACSFRKAESRLCKQRNEVRSPTLKINGKQRSRNLLGIDNDQQLLVHIYYITFLPRLSRCALQMKLKQIYQHWGDHRGYLKTQY